MSIVDMPADLRSRWGIWKNSADARVEPRVASLGKVLLLTAPLGVMT